MRVESKNAVDVKHTDHCIRWHTPAAAWLLRQQNVPQHRDKSEMRLIRRCSSSIWRPHPA